jgi:hypothetical protein
VFIEELGDGDFCKHHSNIYRELLESMGVKHPEFHTREFAHSSAFPDSAFEIAVLWLSLSLFPRHYLPEMLGLNLAVELAGLGGPYLEARDTLRYFGFPTIFVDLHNAADNVSAGHAALAMNTIETYMNDLADREGPHNLDDVWYRIWAGLSSTQPLSNNLNFLVQKIKTLFNGVSYDQLAPTIFEP